MWPPILTPLMALRTAENIVCFDGNFLMKYADKQMIKKGNKIMRIPLSYNGKIIELRDSYSLFPKKLASFPSSFPEAFKGTEIQKEFFPYDYYTYERIEKCLEYEEYQEWMCETGGDCEIDDPPTNRIGNFRECVKECHINQDDKAIFAHNLVSTQSIIGAPKEGWFDMIKYCQFYCLQRHCTNLAYLIMQKMQNLTLKRSHFKIIHIVL